MAGSGIAGMRDCEMRSRERRSAAVDIRPVRRSRRRSGQGRSAAEPREFRPATRQWGSGRPADQGRRAVENGSVSDNVRRGSLIVRAGSARRAVTVTRGRTGRWSSGGRLPGFPGFPGFGEQRMPVAGHPSACQVTRPPTSRTAGPFHGSGIRPAPCSWLRDGP